MEKVFSEVLSMSVDAMWLIIAVIVVRALLQKAPMYFRKILWGLVGLRLILPFSFKSALSLVPQNVPQAADRVAEQVVIAPVEKGLSFVDVVPFLWITVGIAFIVFGTISYIRLRLKIIDSVQVKGNIYQSERIQSPFVCGFIKPRIYVPYGLDQTTQNCVLQHEEAHIRYADHIIKAVSFVILCIHWFNPLVWVAYIILCKDIELCCDESVVKNCDPDGCKQYAKALLDLGVNKVKITACPVAFGEVGIKTRIKKVISYKKAGKILVFAALCLCVGVLLCFMTEPKVALKEKNEKVEVPKESFKPVPEEVTEPATESVTEITPEPTTEVSVENTTQFETVEIYENYDVETTKPFLKIEPPIYFRNPFDTTHYVTTDPMHDKAAEAGVFANEEEKEALIAILEKNNESELEEVS